MADLFTTVGVTAVFKPTIGPPVDGCYVLISKPVDPQPGGFEAAVWQRTTTLECLASEILWRKPRKGDRFETGGDVYLVEKLLEESDDLEITYKMTVKRTVR